LQSKDNLGRYSGVWDCATSLVKSEGPLALYKGIESQLFRNAVWNGTYFGLIGFLKEDLLAPPSGANPLPYNFGAGVIGGTIATVFNTPFDVCKSRMQNQLKLPGKPLKYVWTLPSLATIISEEGFGAIYKGLGPRLVRLGPGGGVMLMVFTKMQELLAPY
jgi:solute carrier family 25 2-oxodicarboxylate transporter 21